jgi:hypothetical protein
MKHFYRSHDLQVNTLPSGTISYDIFDRSRRYLLAGFSLTDRNEQEVMDRLRTRVDQIILDEPVRMGMNVR